MHLLITDDHRMLAQGLAALLAEEDDVTVVGVCGTGPALLARLADEAALPAPDTLLLDLHLPGGPDGLSLLPTLRRQYPRLKILLFSMNATAALVEQIEAADAHGFVPKTADFDELLVALRAVAAGRRVFPKTRSLPAPGAAAETALLRLRTLSPREREIAALICAGQQAKAIAETLELSAHTVDTHRKNILHKLGLKSAVELMRFAMAHPF